MSKIGETIEVLYYYDVSNWPAARVPPGTRIKVLKDAWESGKSLIYSPSFEINVRRTRCTLIEPNENEFGVVCP